MKRFIYMLSNNNIPTYIGKTKNLCERKSAHKKNFPNDVFEVIDEVETSEWKFWERHYISLYKSWGFTLRNKKCHGGNGCDIMSLETRKKISASSIGKKKTNETKKKMSQRIHSDSTKQKMSESHIKANTEDRINKLSNRMKLWWEEKRKNK